MNTFVPASGTVQVVIAGGEDDGREIVTGESAGTVHSELGHADLRNAFRHAFRFPLDIPPGARIKPGTCIQFRASHSKGPTHMPASGRCEGRIQIEDTADAAAIDPNEASPISGRRYLPNTVKWQIDGDWTAGDRTEAQRTPDLRPLLQAIVDRPGFSRGNHVLFMVWASTPNAVERSVATFDHPAHGGAAGAPELNAEWELRAASPPSFDLAGFGGRVTGGTGASPQHIFRVTNTSDDVDTTESLRWAVAQANAVRPQETPKVISIEVEGIIELDGELNVTADNITITGKIAPGLHAIVGKATRNQVLLMLSGTNQLIEHLRLYRGTPSAGSNGGCLLIQGDTIAARFCSFAFATDETVTIWQGRNVSLQYCLIFWPLNRNLHPKGDHGMGSVVGKKQAPGWNAGITFDKCIIAHCQDRSPMRVQQSHIEWCNLITYNWIFTSSWTGDASSPALIQGNVYKCAFLAGNDNQGTPKGLGWSPRGTGSHQVHVSSDCFVQRADPPTWTRDPGWGVVGGGRSTDGAETPIAFSSPAVPVAVEQIPITELWDHLQPRVGAVLPARSWLDEQMLATVEAAWNRTALHGVVIDCAFRANDPNVALRPAMGRIEPNQSNAPLADYDDGRGWQEALTGP